MIPAEYITFTETNWDKMYEDYLIALKKIRKYKKYFQDKLRNMPKITKEQINHRNIIYETEEDIIFTLEKIERYLPKDKRFFTEKHNNIKKIELIYEYSNIDIKSINKIIENEDLRLKLYEILKGILTEEEFKIICLYYDLGFTQNMIAEELDINQKKVRFYLKDAYDKLINSEKIKLFLQNMD